MILFRDVVQDTSGNAISGATVNVYLTGTTTAATIASDINRTAKANPLTTGADGMIEFYVDPGIYDLKVTVTGATPVTKTIMVEGAYYFVANASSIVGGTTFYLTPGGESATSDDGSFMVNRAGYLTNIRIKSTLAPGAGQSYTYNVLKNGVAVDTFVLTGTVDTLATDTTPVAHVAGDHYRIQLVTSATAATASHRAVLEFV